LPNLLKVASFIVWPWSQWSLLRLRRVCCLSLYRIALWNYKILTRYHWQDAESSRNGRTERTSDWRTCARSSHKTRTHVCTRPPGFPGNPASQKFPAGIPGNFQFL